MLRPLLITTKESSEILKRALKSLEHEKLRIQTGLNYSLKCFIEADLKNYMSQTHIILDVSVFTDQRDDFIELLSELNQVHRKAVVVIYSDSLFAGDLFLHELV